MVGGGVDPTTPNVARMYDYYLGGKSNFEADRRAAEASLEANPTGRTGPLENRAFMLRAVRYLVTEAGIRQFLDLGTGIPTSPNVHQVAQSIAPAARIVYADNGPIVLSHARALMSSSPDGETAYIEGDMRSPKTVLDAPELRAVLDFDKPVGFSSSRRCTSSRTCGRRTTSAGSSWPRCRRAATSCSPTSPVTWFPSRWPASRRTTRAGG
jgi:hypothetical protein